MTDEEKNNKIKNMICIECNGRLKLIKKDVECELFEFKEDIYYCLQCGVTIKHLKLDISDR